MGRHAKGGAGRSAAPGCCGDCCPADVPPPLRLAAPPAARLRRLVLYALLILTALTGAFIAGTLGCALSASQLDAQVPAAVVPDTSALVVMLANNEPDSVNVYVLAWGVPWQIGKLPPGKMGMWILPSSTLRDANPVQVVWTVGTQHGTSDLILRKPGIISVFSYEIGTPPVKARA